MPDVLMQVEVPIMTNSECQAMFYKAGHPKAIRESFMCAGYPNGERDSCEVNVLLSRPPAASSTQVPSDVMAHSRML